MTGESRQTSQILGNIHYLTASSGSDGVGTAKGQGRLAVYKWVMSHFLKDISLHRKIRLGGWALQWLKGELPCPIGGLLAVGPGLEGMELAEILRGKEVERVHE